MSEYNCFRKQRSKGLVLSLLLILGLCLSTMPAQSQDKKVQKKSADENEVIRVTSNLVNLDVIVKDKKGKIITDLKKEDFIINENGVQQDIQFFDSTLTAGDEPGRAAPAPTNPGTLPPNKLPRNIISLVLDLQTTEAANLKHVRDGIVKYIRERISDTDSVALFSIAGGLQLLQPFTQDKTKLIAAVERAYSSSNVSKTSEQRGIAESIATLRDQLASAPAGTEPITTSAGGSAAAQALIAQHVLEQYIQLRSVLSVQQTRPVLAALAAICEGLRPIPSKKTLVLFSQGFVAPQALDWQLKSTIDIANRANVAIYIIDSSGLTGGAPQSGALVPGGALAGISAANSMESRRRASAGESVFDITRQEGLNRQQDLLYQISDDTGGRFIKNTNDIGAGLDRIDAEIRSRYTLAYRSTDPNFDGGFRKIKIDVKRPGVSIVARPGYYAIPPSQIVPMSPEDKKLLASFATWEGHSTLPLSLELNSFRTQQGYYVVPLSFEIPPSAVQFYRNGEGRRLQLDVLGVIRAEGEEKILSRLGGFFDVGLTAQQYESIVSDKIFYRQDMQLEAGVYTIDLIVRDRLSGRTAAKRERLVLPVANSDFSTTEAVLSRRVERVKQPAVSNDVLSEGDVLIRPSPSREFQSTDSLIIFFKLYNPAPARDTGKPLVRVTVTLMKDGKQATRPLDYELSETVPEPVPHLTFAKYLKLTGLPPGKYAAVIESRDMVQKRLLKQDAWFVITQ